MQLCFVLSDQAAYDADIHAGFAGSSRSQLGSSVAVPAVFTYVPPMPANMSAMKAAKLGSMCHDLSMMCHAHDSVMAMMQEFDQQ